MTIIKKRNSGDELDHTYVDQDVTSGATPIFGSPTTGSQVAIKDYVDHAIGTILDYQFNNTASNIDQESETTYKMTTLIEAGEETISRATITAAADQLLFVFATESGEPGGLDLVLGIYNAHVHLAISGGGARTVDTYWTLSSIDDDGTNEVLLMTSETEPAVSGSETAYDIHAVLAADVEVATASRFLFKFYGSGNSGNDATMAFHVEGLTGTHLAIKAPSEIFNTIYARTDGNSPTQLPVAGGGTGAANAGDAAEALGVGATDTPTFAGVNLGDENLNTYNEGTWTPTITLVGGAGNIVPVFTTNDAEFTQIGNKVFFSLYFTGDGGDEGAGTGAVNIALPVTASGSSNILPYTSYFLCQGLDEVLGGTYIGPSATTMSLRYLAANTHVGGTITGAEFANVGRVIRITGFYLV